MNKLLGLFLIALAFLAPQSAFAVTCFWVGGTGTWDTTNTGGGGSGGIKWASASGGATPCGGGGTGGSPSSGDAATFDASSGGGTVTVNYGGLITLQSFDIGTFTGTLDFATNNNSITVTNATAFNITGAGIKTLNMGSGTWTTSNNQGLWNCGTCANLTLVPGTSTIAFTGTGGNVSRRFIGGGKTYANVSFVSGTSPVQFSNTGTTIGTLTISPGNTVIIDGSATVTTLTNISGSSSNQTLFTGTNPIFGPQTLAITNNWTCDWCGFSGIAFSGAGSKTATNSFDGKTNTGTISITPPSGGGGGGGRIIGG